MGGSVRMTTTRHCKLRLAANKKIDEQMRKFCRSAYNSGKPLTERYMDKVTPDRIGMSRSGLIASR